MKNGIDFLMWFGSEFPLSDSAVLFCGRDTLHFFSLQEAYVSWISSAASGFAVSSFTFCVISVFSSFCFFPVRSPVSGGCCLRSKVGDFKADKSNFCMMSARESRQRVRYLMKASIRVSSVTRWACWQNCFPFCYKCCTDNICCGFGG